MFGRFEDEEDVVRPYLIRADLGNGCVLSEEVEALPSEMREEVFMVCKEEDFPPTVYIWELVEVAQWDLVEAAQWDGGYYYMEDDRGPEES
jgi:hypothetical protein